MHLCDVSSELLAQALTQQPEMSGTVADVADAQQVDRVFNDVRQSLGGLDVLVNNAGIAGPTAAVEDISPDDWSRTLAVNITGQFLCPGRGSVTQGGGRWFDHQRVLRRRPTRLSNANAVCGLEMGCHRLHPEPGHGAGSRTTSA